MAIDNQQDTKYHSRSLSSFLLRSAPGRVLMFELAVGWLMVLPVEGLSGRKQSGARGEPSQRARRRAPRSGRVALCEPALLRVAEPPSLVSRGGGATAVPGTAVLFGTPSRRVVAGVVATATIKIEGQSANVSANGCLSRLRYSKNYELASESIARWYLSWLRYTNIKD